MTTDFQPVPPTKATAWRDTLAFPNALVWLHPTPRTEASHEQRTRDHAADHVALQHALPRLFANQTPPETFPETYPPTDLQLRRDLLGRPYVTWHGILHNWAERTGHDARLLHISNTHDGPTHLLFTAYHPDLIGVGVDVVSLERLRRPGKNAAYLRRFAAQFMGAEERATLEAEAHPVTDEEAFRIRVAAHFSLMEAASKACGTGLKLGVGMGTAHSLPPRELGALTLTPEVKLWFGPVARNRLVELQATRTEAHWNHDGTTLAALVLLWRT